MVQKIKFKKPMRMRDTLTNYKGIYAVESEVNKRIIYGVADGLFAILMDDGAAYCPIHEAPEMAQMIVDRRIRDEIIDIYQDIKDLQCMEVVFGLERRRNEDLHQW